MTHNSQRWNCSSSDVLNPIESSPAEDEFFTIGILSDQSSDGQVQSFDITVDLFSDFEDEPDANLILYAMALSREYVEH